MTKHKWYNEIVAWASGAEIEYCSYDIWDDWNEDIGWYEGYEYRIKPQPKEPQYLYVYQHETNGISFGYKPHGAVNMWQTKVIGKIKLEVDND